MNKLLEIYQRGGAFDQCLYQYPRFFAMAIKSGRDWSNEELLSHLSCFCELFFDVEDAEARAYVKFLAGEGVFEGAGRETLLRCLSSPLAREGFERLWRLYSELRRVLAESDEKGFDV